MDRKIIHIDMDAFYASIEQRDNPGLQGKPVAVGGERQRGVVAAASYEARKFGVRSAMPSVTAKKKCPQLIFVKPRFQVYKEVSSQIRKIFLEYTDLVEPLSLDEAYLDVSENKFNIPLATEIAREIKARILAKTGLKASAGVSVNKFLAKIASDYDKPDGLFIIKPHQAEGFVEKLEIERFYGIGKVTAEKMHQMGIHTGKDLKTYSLSELVRIFGKVGSFYYTIARGLDDRPVDPNRIRKSVGTEHTYDHDLFGLPEILYHLKNVENELVDRLRRNSALGRTLTLKVKFEDFEQLTRSRSLVEFYTPATIHAASVELAGSIEYAKRGVRLLGLTLSNFEHPEELDAYQLSIDFAEE
ncbi:MAG: DNA polymerase IV [Bacteroidales bacterium]|nr:DNA polymerase IV [Bacteroidales bacterium]